MKVNSCKLTVISFVAAAIVCRAELTASLHPEEASLFVYEPFTLLLEANSGIEPPDVPSGSGFSITSITPVQTNSFRIEMIAEESGTLTVPPITVVAGNETNQTAPLRITVAAPRRAGEITLSVALSTTNLYVDQPVKMTVTWISKVPFTRCNELLLDIPVLRNSDWEVYPLDPGVPEQERIGLPVNNQRVIARKTSTEAEEQLAFDFMLVPRHEGITRSADIRLNCALLQDRRASSQYPSYFDNHFFNRPEKNDRFERIYLSAPQPELTVLALPEAGRTVRYSSIVGPCTAGSFIRPSDTVVGQPMLLNVELNDLAFGEQIKTLPDAVLEEVGSEFQITPRPMHETATENSRSFTYVLRPLRSGITTVPALALQIFDPAQKTYRTLRTKPLNIRVDPDGKQTVYQPDRSEDRKPKTPLTGIRGNWKESRLHMNTYGTVEFFAHNAWAFWLLPPLLWLALRPWLRRRDRCRADPAYARALLAAHNFRRAARRHNEETAWKNYLADRFALNAEAVTFETVAREFKKRNIDSELLQTVCDCFARQDAVRYSRQKDSRKPCAALRELVRRIEKASPVLLLLVCLLGAFNSSAKTPDQLFEQAMQMRAEKPDEAQPLFTEAALGFEAGNEFLNAGNSWFFANENGRALANYLAAESRMPFNRQIRESIAFIRTQRTDSFQTSEKPASKVSKVWKQFGRWEPSIRFGLLTFVYLTGWALFLIARFIGKTVPRGGWFLLGILALIPAFSLLASLFQPLEGVVIEPTEARLGPGYAYDKAYDTILHEATEFQWLDLRYSESALGGQKEAKRQTRDGWIHARMPDKSEAWLSENACVPVK